MYKELIKKIKESKTITIFRHERPDGDAVFSSYALKQFLNDNFKDKKVYLVGNDKYDVIKSDFKVSDSIIKNSLCFILDTATMVRVDDKRCFELKPFTIKIDHHPVYEKYGDLNYTDEDMPAACAYLASIFMSKEFKKYKISNKTAEYLLSGIVTDTLCFKTASCDSSTFELTSKLLKLCDTNISDINYNVFSKSKEEYLAVSKLRSYTKIFNKIAYIIVSEKDIKKIGMSYNDIKNNVDILSGIKGINIWAIFVYNKKTKLYDGSIRSLNGYIINKIATKYNGGGHNHAVGVKSLKISQIKALLKELNSVKSLIK